jgi:hypothetical protein
MTTLATVFTLACATCAVALAFAGTYWLGDRNGRRRLVRDDIADGFEALLAPEDDDEGGEGVPTPDDPRVLS